MHHIFFNHSLHGEHLNFHALATVSDAAVNQRVHIYLFDMLILVHLNVCPGMRLLDLTVASFYIPINSLQAFQFCHIFINNCYFFPHLYIRITTFS